MKATELRIGNWVYSGKEIQIIEHDNYDKGRNAGLNDAIHIIHMEVLT